MASDYGCPTWLELINKWTFGDRQTATLLQTWFGCLATEQDLLGPDGYRRLQDFLYELDERDPEALPMIFTTAKMLKGKAKC